MLHAVNGTTNVYAVPQTETAQAKSYNVAMRGASDLERAPEVDTFEAPKKKKKGRKILGWTVTLAAIASAIAAFSKGKKAGADGLFKRLGAGYTEMWNALKGKLSKKGKDAVDDAAKKVEDAAANTKNVDPRAHEIKPKSWQKSAKAVEEEIGIGREAKSAQESMNAFIENEAKKVSEALQPLNNNEFSIKLYQSAGNVSKLEALKQEIAKRGTAQTEKDIETINGFLKNAIEKENEQLLNNPATRKNLSTAILNANSKAELENLLETVKRVNDEGIKEQYMNAMEYFVKQEELMPELGKLVRENKGLTDLMSRRVDIELYGSPELKESWKRAVRENIDKLLSNSNKMSSEELIALKNQVGMDATPEQIKKITTSINIANKLGH